MAGLLNHANIAIFIPHEGCTNSCIFCNQRAISGQQTRPRAEDVHKAVHIALNSLGERAKDAQIAFFGGSFTAIEREYMLELLEAAHGYIKNGQIGSVRCSTRPDAIDDEILDLLADYGVRAIELGAQSMDDRVLAMNMRGHTSADTVRASRLICAHGFELGLQMMTGMYGDTPEGTLRTALQIVSLAPDTVRIYPTLVLEKTALAALYRSGKYCAQPLEEAVGLCTTMLEMFEQADIRVIKLGLHSTDREALGYIAGPYHEAFRELCQSRLYLKNALALLSAHEAGEYTLAVSARAVSQMTGQGRCNINKLAEMGYRVKVLADASITQAYKVEII